jgi:hypothetical protein
LLAGLALSLSACGDQVLPVLGEPIQLELPVDTAEGPRLTEGPGGNLVLSWMKRGAEGTTLEYAALEDGQFGSAREVVLEPRMFVNWADLPGVVQVADRHWLAHWLRYSADLVYSYDVVVAQSFDDGETWTEPLVMHTDGTPTEHGFVSTYRSPDGVALLWLDGRETPDRPMTLRTGTATASGERIGEMIIDESVCDCCQTDVAISANGPVAVYRDRTSDEIRDIYITRFENGSWQPGERLHADDWKIPGCPVNGPSIVADGQEVAIVWFTAANGEPKVRLVRSMDGGKTFGAPIEIASGPISGYVGLTMVPDGRLAVSWVSRGSETGNAIHLTLVDSAANTGPVKVIADGIQQVRVFPQLGYQDGSLYLFWTDETDDTRRLYGTTVPVT